MKGCEPPIGRLGFPNGGETMICYIVTKPAFFKRGSKLQLEQQLSKTMKWQEDWSNRSEINASNWMNISSLPWNHPRGSVWCCRGLWGCCQNDSFCIFLGMMQPERTLERLPISSGCQGLGWSPVTELREIPVLMIFEQSDWFLNVNQRASILDQWMSKLCFTVSAEVKEPLCATERCSNARSACI